jgi:hypothetical protein
MPDEGPGARRDLQPSLYHSIPAYGLKTCEKVATHLERGRHPERSRFSGETRDLPENRSLEYPSRS